MNRFLCVLLVAAANACFASGNTPSAESGWVPLFNGRNFDGWYVSLFQRNKNEDPSHVFKVEDGMIHVLDVPLSKSDTDVFGYLATNKELSDCHIRAEFKWGNKRFASRATGKRDSGLMYYVVGPDKIYPRSLEFQIQETDTGDLWITDGVSVATVIENQNPPTYTDLGLTPHRQNKMRIAKLADFEIRDGWNTVELILDGDTSTHLVNGRVVMRTWNLRQPDPGDPSKMIRLDRGRFLLQAEGAEIWFRNIQMKPLAPKAPAAQSIEGTSQQLSLESSFAQLLHDRRTRDIIEMLIDPDVLANPNLANVQIPAQQVLSELLGTAPEQMQALDRALRTVTK